MYKRMSMAAVALLLATACNQDPTSAASSNELVLAQNAQVIAQDVANSTHTTSVHWIGRLLDTLRTTDDPEALAFLQEARDWRDSARVAFAAEDREAARHYLQLSFRAVLSAVIEIYPNAPERTGQAVDQALDRIETFLGDRDAPRIRAILDHVKDLRAQADAALASGDSVSALVLNLRGIQILHRLVEHVRDHHQDHDEVADSEMNEVGY
jgi:hypothetical protein